MRIKTKLAILFTLLFVFGCKKDEPESEAPIITFIDANLSSSETSAIINFEFFDKDGDLGLTQDENSGAFEYNVFVDYYEKINGAWQLKSPIIIFDPDIKLPDGGTYDSASTNVRMPYLENEAQRTLQGDIRVSFLFDKIAFNETAGPDTFRYEFYIKDRALQNSNVITTTELIVE